MYFCSHLEFFLWYFVGFFLLYYFFLNYSKSAAIFLSYEQEDS